ncbi:hypothetical protein COCMIDRAFT_1682 [Bipolaris oryzae ATCC 44560]|uniref:BTB domain-containing protein n=1 Tax=Bipolaris oryzae ATCC 44560 TaxID=930090 RepID=W6ZCV0_COCMI|nr:uncharacterized protein COCMIDRAFT_1682 [Bipolaris oryzae ATCC 44560]EUC49647.1 hypothetical protein COCMIDRAFT_1682 [Bipolaris oryzae ATCC 44560]
MDQRGNKRVYSSAFQNSNDEYRKVLRSVAGSSATSQSSYIPAVLFGTDKENSIPFLDTEADQESLHSSQNHIRLPLGSYSLGCQPCLPCISQVLEESGRGITLQEPGQFEMDSSPLDFHLDLNSSSPLNEIAGFGAYTGPPTFEDPNTAFVQPGHDGGFTWPALHFQDLSLYDTPKTMFPDQFEGPVVAARISVSAVASQSLQYAFPTLHPNDILIIFDKGHKVMKLNKYLLMLSSRFFASILTGTYTYGYTHCLRLRNDFPLAIAAMIRFLESGAYALDPMMRTQCPNLTLFDLHIHAYVLGTKYDMRKLCDYAINQYVDLGRRILDKSSGYVHQITGLVSPGVNSFLDSLVLIWRNTRDSEDALRQAALELVKVKINRLLRVRFFQTLLWELPGFGNDVVASLQEDGFDVKALPVRAGMQEKAGVSFGRA